MSASADKLREKVNSEEELEVGLMAEIEEALDTADLLAESAFIQLDKLTADKEETKALISARPKMAFEVFTGDVTQYQTFRANQERLYEMFYDGNAPDKGASQQLFQLSKILSPTLPNRSSVTADRRTRLRRLQIFCPSSLTCPT